jgi:hypothetical protein
VLKTAWD